MHWIDIITVRSSEAGLESSVRRICESLMSDMGTKDSLQLQLLVNPSVPTDVSVHVHLHSMSAEAPPSGVAERLAGILEDYGLVHRARWCEIEGGNP